MYGSVVSTVMNGVAQLGVAPDENETGHKRDKNNDEYGLHNNMFASVNFTLVLNQVGKGKRNSILHFLLI